MPNGRDPNRARIEDAAQQLGPLLDELVLVGGCAAGLLVTDSGGAPIRPTMDVDLVVEASTYADYQHFSRRLEDRGFSPGTMPGDPICRWRHGGVVLDVMPLAQGVLGFSNRWYRGAMWSPLLTRLASGRVLRHIDAPHFIATKLEAFRNRGGGDYLVSADLEDVIVVVDGRRGVDREVREASADLRSFLIAEWTALLNERYFTEALPGYFAAEDRTGGRASIVLERLRRMAALA